MNQSYRGNYIKIYFWQGISLVLNFLSMFIVVPYLTKDTSIYGIYTVCISFSIFLAYADLGFIGAGQKYAAEHFARGAIKEEIQLIGFTGFILLIFLLLFSVVFFYISLHPELIIKNLTSHKDFFIASSLLQVLALFTPVTLLQRVAQMIFGIRLEDYIVQRINIIGSLIKIISVLWFFRNEHYDIVGYFLFGQIINLIAYVVILLIARRLYDYNFKKLIVSVHFSKAVFLKTKNLAFTSLYLTILWILYYELDPTIIGKFIGVEKVAVYAIGLTILSFFRSILGILFSPFNARFNHFIGINDIFGLKSFFLQVVLALAPLVILPIITIFFLAKPLILSWVGANYIDSIAVVKFLVLCNLFAFITYPVGILMMAQERVKEMYFVNTLIPLIYWSGIIMTYSFFGLKSFAIFKLIAFIVSALLYFNIMLKFLKLNIKQCFDEIFRPLLYPVIFIIFATIAIRNFLPCEKSKLNLLIVGASIGLLIIISFIIQYFSAPKIRDHLDKILKYRNK